MNELSLPTAQDLLAALSNEMGLSHELSLTNSKSPLYQSFLRYIANVSEECNRQSVIDSIAGLITQVQAIKAKNKELDRLLQQHKDKYLNKVYLTEEHLVKVFKVFYANKEARRYAEFCKAFEDSTLQYKLHDTIEPYFHYAHGFVQLGKYLQYEPTEEDFGAEMSLVGTAGVHGCVVVQSVSELKPTTPDEVMKLMTKHLSSFDFGD